MTREEWEYCHQKSLELFTWGQCLAEEHGLILVDTKYEFGRDSQGTIRLIDEIHTPDSSRFWLSHSYDECFQKGQEPDNINKEFIRVWLKQQKEKLGEYPEVPSDKLAQLAIRYFQLYHLITGKEFELTPLTTGEITLPPSYNDDSSIHLITAS